jgi:hypothetical protein
MAAERRVVDNRVFLLGLDELYREAMKRHERDELLRCARDTAGALAVAPADVPIEGYYSEDEMLTEYFRLMRALQDVPVRRAGEVRDLKGFQRLKEITESPLFGRPIDTERLLAAGSDSLSLALKKTFPDWTVAHLTRVAYEIAAASEDFSLVGLAALSRDAVVLAALRESVVLYAVAVAGAAKMRQELEYIWQVDRIVEERAIRFVGTFNKLFGEAIPQPAAENAEVFWAACGEWKIVGRCVRLGFDDRSTPVRHYHWAIDQDDKYNLVVTEFWDTELWTTERYRARREAQLS